MHKFKKHEIIWYKWPNTSTCWWWTSGHIFETGITTHLWGITTWNMLTCSIHLMSHISISQMCSIFKSRPKIHQQTTLHKEILNTNLHHVSKNRLKLLDIHEFKSGSPQELPMKGVQVSLVGKTPTDTWIIPNRMKTKTMKHKSSNGIMSPSKDD